MLALTAECGELRVPENPDRARTAARSNCSSRACRPSASTRSADPLFLIAGGPGTSAVDLYTSSAGPFDRVRRDRDIILVDQRGTGRSHRLDCDYGDQNLFERIDEVEVGPANIKCRDELSKKSDLRMYTTSVAVRDLDAVRAVLGYERINLYGNSYGTRVAQHYARRYPKATRTLILDGVVNPEVVLGPGDRHRCGARAGAHPRALRARCGLRQGVHRSVRRLPRTARAAQRQAGARPWSATSPRAGPSISTSPRGICPPC